MFYGCAVDAWPRVQPWRVFSGVAWIRGPLPWPRGAASFPGRVALCIIDLYFVGLYLFGYQ